jgi:pimeloyl-ACP methyl ester carboxylesterase
VQLVLPVTVEPDAAPLAAPSTAPLTDASRQTIRYSTSRDGAGIAWAETGEGPPLLRGGHWLGHLEHDWVSPVWRPLLDRLARGRRLVRYDPRGTGLSERGFGDGVTVETLADDLEAVADAAGLERFPIYAISQSVPVALTFAARRPERVSRLILLNGSVQGSTARGDAAATETMVAMIRSGWGVHGSAFMKAVATLFMPSATPEEVESIVEMQALSATAEVAARIRQVIGEIDVTEVLPHVTAPALIMHCSGDVIQSPDQSKFLARSLANAEFHLCDSPNHIVAPSDPIWAGCLDKVDRFLDGDDLA